MADIEKLNRWARRQRGLFTRWQALAAGFTDGQITARLRSGEWDSPRPEVYRIAGAPQSWEQAVLAVTLSSGSTALASHRTAAHLWDLRGFRQPDQIEVIAPFARPLRLAGVRGHRSRAIFDEDRTARLGIPAVTAERTLVDLSGSLSQIQLGRVLDDAIRREVATLEAFRRCATRLAPGPGRSMTRVRAMLADRVPGYSPGESDLESRALRVLVAAGLPPPRQQHRMTLRGKKVRIDLAYPDQKIAIELDSWEFHGNGNRTAFTVDKARANDLVVIGWSPTSFTSDMTDEYLVDTVMRLWRRAAAQCSQSGAA
jgi:hypothetical protein